MPRRTADVVALILAVTVALTVVLTTVAILWVRVTSPAQDITAAAESIRALVNVMVGALVGYMAGRSVDDDH